ARRPAGRRDLRLVRLRGVARVPRGAPAARARRARGRSPGRARDGAPMSRTPLIAGNWKMHGARGEAVALAGALAKSVGRVRGREVVIAPPFTALAAARPAIARPDNPL